MAKTYTLSCFRNSVMKFSHLPCIDDGVPNKTGLETIMFTLNEHSDSRLGAPVHANANSCIVQTAAACGQYGQFE